MRIAILLLVLNSVPIRAAERLVLVAGGETAGFKEPFGLDFLPDGTIVVAEYGAHKIMRIDANGKVSTLAGTGTKGYADGSADKAQFNGPHNLAVAKDGTIYVADTLNHVVRKIDAKSKTVSTIAGTGKKGYLGDGGPAKDAQFNQLYHVALNKEQTSLYVADLGNFRIRAIDLKSGTINTVAGNGKKGVPEIGAKAIDAPLVDPRACAVDSKGRIYILERSAHALRVVEAGAIYLAAGTGKQGATGDGGTARNATFNAPKMLWIDKNDNVFIADTENNLIRKYIAEAGKIERISGSGKMGSNGIDGPPQNAELAKPHGVAVAPDGTIYISDSLNARVLKIVK